MAQSDMDPPDQGAPIKTLTLLPPGNGGGTVVSDPPGLQCPPYCSAQFPADAQVKLTATPDAGWLFDSWTQACTGSDPVCSLLLSAAQSVGFSFLPAPAMCTAPEVQCGALCVDTATTSNHCGDCNTACALGENCVAGACVAPTCTPPFFLCGTQCVNPSSDSANCGGCGNTCMANKACMAAACVGTGNLQFSATWNRVGDGDLLVTTPSGNTLWRNNRGPSAATDFGQMDRDDTTGTGPENIYWDLAVTPPSGTYYVCFETSFYVMAPSAADPVQASISVQLPGMTAQSFMKTFTGMTSINGACDPTLDTFVASITYP
jgi:hypothetical protein